MALRKTLTKRLSSPPKVYRAAPTLRNSPISSSPSDVINAPNAAQINRHRDYLNLRDSFTTGFLRRLIHRRASCNPSPRLPEVFSLPVGDILKEKIGSVNVARDRLRLNNLNIPAPPPVEGNIVNGASISGQEARKLLRVARLENLKTKLREIPQSSVAYSDFVRVCVQECGNEKEGVEFARMLDETGNVIVLGNLVFLRPEQVAKSVEKVIFQSVALPNDPRRKELEQMERDKAIIDEKARAQVRGELYCGLGFLMAQTIGFMRLTFWELSWDVMEPICFFSTSAHFFMGYAFFLRTSKEPSFEGFFLGRFEAKQRKLMKMHNFDVEKYHALRRACYPSSDGCSSCFNREEGAYSGTNKGYA